MSCTHVLARVHALRRLPLAFFSTPVLCLASVAVISSGLETLEPFRFQLLTY